MHWNSKINGGWAYTSTNDLQHVVHIQKSSPDNMLHGEMRKEWGSTSCHEVDPHSPIPKKKWSKPIIFRKKKTETINIKLRCYFSYFYSNCHTACKDKPAFILCTTLHWNHHQQLKTSMMSSRHTAVFGLL